MEHATKILDKIPFNYAKEPIDEKGTIFKLYVSDNRSDYSHIIHNLELGKR